MPQFNLTEEDISITRADLYRIAEAHPDDIYGFIGELQEMGMNQAAIDKLLSDLHSY